MPIKDTLTRSDLSLTRSESRIVQVLLSDYPVSGLGRASGLARRAGVSDPTVARLAVKLGFSGFAALQAQLLAEVEARLRSPLHMMEARRPPGGEGAAQVYMRSALRQVEAASHGVPPALYGQAAGLILDAKKKVMMLGGRFSRHLAGMLGGYIRQFRADVVDLGALALEDMDLLLDADRRDVLVVFDYRRYQTDVIRFAEGAASRGVRVVLFTDPWLSPIGALADVAIVAPIEVSSPYDTLAPAAVQVEALVAECLAATGQGLRGRLERLEAIRAEAGITLDAPARRPATHQPGPPRHGH